MMLNNIFQKKIYVLFFLFGFWGLFSCTGESGTEPEQDKQNPAVSIISPETNSVLEDTMTIRINATDNNKVSKVEFYIDNNHMVDADDTNGPFEYFWNLSGYDIGSIHTLFVKAYDDAGNIGISDTVKIYYKWILLHQDTNEPFVRDIDKLFIRSSNTQLEFRIEMNDIWGDPHNGESTIDCAIFLDTDQNPNTGLKPDTSYWFYQVNDIGPDFVAVVGVEGDSLWNWNSSDTTWERYKEFNYLNLSNNTNVFELGINLEDIGNPTFVDIVGANITFDSDSTSWDWAPNENHLTYEIDGLYLGKTNKSQNRLLKNIFIKPRNQRYYFKPQK